MTLVKKIIDESLFESEKIEFSACCADDAVGRALHMGRYQQLSDNLIERLG